jgi:hypothetical protein
VLRFTAASGEPVLTSLIFAVEWRMAVDLFAEWIGDPGEIANNCDDGK